MPSSGNRRPRLSAAEKRTRALELHLAGATYDAIAKSVGYASRSGAYKAVQEGLKQLGDPPTTAEADATDLARLDAMLTGLWPKARRGDVQAVDRVLKISERREQIVLRAKQQAAPAAGSPATPKTPLDQLEERRQQRQRKAK